ncbi:type I polyketide synthase [Streptomyces geranii]|uniref:type I polyketide synthase n=1 Tax=Streptomyces geranii TaxID=2058923 RepID=UPI000D04317A|nr:type I polyketide synthase [Streptomyces geranii]
MNASHPSELDRRLARDPIAIVGLSALYPKSRDLRAFWDNVVSAADCIEDVPETHWNVAEHYDSDPTAPDRTYSKRGGFIPAVPFNPLEFGLPPNTLEVTDVLQLLSLVVARDLLRDAGSDQQWYDASRTGVVLGVTGANQLTQPLSARLQTPVLKEVVRSCGLSDRDADEIAEKFKLAFAPWEENSFPGMLGNVVAGRIANRLDLGGTNMTIDAACASSLGAVKAAVSELLERRSDMMLVGGCDAENTIFMYLCFSKTPAFSKAGHIRPFDENADGTLIGEGIGMLALRRLSDAERDGNRVYAVIRGIGSSSDGRFKSIYAPRKEGQMAALRRAYEDADCSPASVELFEAHGTGTAVGEATELSALSAVVSQHTEERQFAAVGSVKSQIGHTKAAAGAAGMIKLALALHHKLLPPTINVDTPNPALDWPQSPFYVGTRTRPWIRDPRRPQRRAGVSSFGFGGTNFHLVMEEHGDGDDLRVMFPVSRVHTWHEPDMNSLIRALEGGAESRPGQAPANHPRLALVARTEEELAELRTLAAAELRARGEADSWTHPKGIYFRRSAAPTGKVAALFAGQGSQYVAPGRTAVLALPPLRAAFDRANAAFGDHELPLSRVAFPPPAFDEATRTAQESALRRTEYAQPAIGALAAGHFRYLAELGFDADGFLGHSFGELAALWAAGAIDDDTYFALARARGAAMAPPAEPGFDPGAMAAVTASAAQVEQLLAAHPGLTVCNRNAPDQVVVGGATDAVERLVEAADTAGIRALRLPVSAAFHTPFVAHAVDAFGRQVAGAHILEPRRPVFANSPGAAYGSDVNANRRTLVDQLVQPVQFADRVEEMYAAGFRTFVEFGPKGVLTQLVHRILGEREHFAVQLDPGSGGDADTALKRAVAQLVVLGLPLATADRYVSEPEAVPPVKGMTVPLNGINHVPQARKDAYREALENGYRVTGVDRNGDGGGGGAVHIGRETVPVPGAVIARGPLTPSAQPSPAPVATSTAVAVRPVAQPSASVAPPVPAAHTLESEPVEELDRTTAPGADRLSGLIADHLALHDDYLQGQLNSAQRLMGILERADEQGRVDAVIPGVATVKEHGLAIGRTHLRANEILRDLAAMEIGTLAPAAPAVPATPVIAAPAPLPVAPVAAAVESPPVALPARAPATAPAPAPAPVAGPVASEPPSTAVTEDDVQAALLDIVSQKTGYPAEMLDLGMDVEADLGIDSIKRVEIMGVLQERFPSPTPVGPEQLAELRTLNEIVGFVLSLGGSSSLVPQVQVQAQALVQTRPASAIGAQDVADVLLGVVSDKTGYPAETLDLDMDVEADLGIDSIKRVEIMGVLQERFPSPTPVGPEQLAELRTLNEIVGFMLSLNGGSGSSASTPAPSAAPAVDGDAVRGALLDVVAAKTGYPAEMLDLGMDVEADLGIDSIKRVEIMGVLQERFPSPTPVGPEQLAELRTLGDIVGFVAGLSEAPSSAPSAGSPAPVAGPADREQASRPASKAAVVSAPPALGRGQAALAELPTPDRLVDAYPLGAAAVVVDDGSAVAEASAARLVSTGWRVRVLRLPGVAQRVTGATDLPLTGWGASELATRFEELGDERVHLVLGFAAADELPWAEGVRRLAHSLLVAKHAVGPLTKAAASGHRAAFVTVTRLDGTFGLGGVSEDAVPAGGIGGLVKTLAVEAPELFCRAVDLTPALGSTEAAELVLEEVYDAAAGPVQVGRDGTHRVALTLGSAPGIAPGDTTRPTTPPPALGADDLLVVTGGGRGITARCTVALAAANRPGLLLLGRTALGEEPEWARGLADAAALKAAAVDQLKRAGEKPTPKRVEQLYQAVIGEREVRSTLAEIRAAGSEVEYLAVDIADAAATAAALAPYQERITGVVHGAGVLADQLISAKKAAEIDRVFSVKLGGLRSVVAALPAEQLRHVVLFSSVAGFFGNRGQSDYAMANEVLNAWAAAFRRSHPQAHVTALNWGAWDSGMVSPQIKAVFQERGIALIPVGTGTLMFTEQFGPERAGDVVTVLGPTTPLSAREPVAPTSAAVLERDLAGLITDPLVADHVIGDAPVLPAAAALGWAAGAVERLTGGTVSQVRDFAVHKGVVFDEDGSAGGGRPFQLSVDPTPDGAEADVAIRSTNADGTVRPHYAARVILGDAGYESGSEARGRVTGLPALGGGSDAQVFYADGTLFHGVSLRGLRRVLASGEDRLVLECALAEHRPAGGAFGTGRYAPGTADLLLQAALVWMRLHRDTASLPMGVARVDLYEALPDGEPFVVVVEPESAAVNGNGSGNRTSAALTVTACTPGGRVLTRFTGVSLVSTPQLAAKFASR